MKLRGMDITQATSITARGFRISLLTGCLILSCFSRSQAQFTTAREIAENLTVMIDAYFPDDEVPEWGAGIIVGKQASFLYIATADHVLLRNSRRSDNILVQPKWVAASRASDKRFRAEFVRAEKDLMRNILLIH